MLAKHWVAKSCQNLIEEYVARDRPRDRAGEKLTFAGTGGRDVYNIMKPFMDQGERVIAGRVEGRNTERSEIVFFVEHGGVWMPRVDTPTLPLQDPFFTFIGKRLVLGGVDVSFDKTGTRAVSWRTKFYRGTCINDLDHFATGPEEMKDIRLVELADGRIGVFTRPFNVAGARAVIGYTSIDRLDDLDAQAIEGATNFQDQFLPDEWGGANEAQLLSNGLIGILGHVASMEKGAIRHYHAMTFALNPATLEKTPITIIARRADFPAGASKRPDLQDVTFSGGLDRLQDGTAWLYAGVSDAEADRLRIDDPFVEYEQLHAFSARPPARYLEKEDIS